MATIICPEHPSPVADAEALRKACEGWGTNEKAIISILGYRNWIQRKLIREAYEQQYQEDLVKRLEKELSGRFEVAYSSKKLSHEDYAAFIESLCKKIESWQHKHMSFAGRIILIKTVLYGIVQFWSSVLPFPKYVIEEVGKSIRRFLWKGSSEGRYHAKVAWKELCLPKEEGGLGFRELGEWNRVCVAKHLWDIATKKDTIWVHWIHSYRLQTKSVWRVKKNNSDSWFWRKILQAMGMMQGLFQIKTHSGKGVSFWFDAWTKLGPLWTALSAEERLCLQIPVEATFDQITTLVMPRERRRTTIMERVIREFSQAREHMELGQDKWIWKSNNGQFSTAYLWYKIRNQGEPVDWRHIIWKDKGIARQDVICWLLFKGKLDTKDRLNSWGVLNDGNCSFCDQDESINHLFFECKLGKTIWERMLTKLGMEHTIGGWSTERS